MKLSPMKKEEVKLLKRKALALSAEFSMREIAKMLDKSHGWVCYAIKEMKKELNLPVDYEVKSDRVIHS